jgi:type IV secretion system protein TrbG
MDTRRTMIAPKAACMAGSLALLLTTAIPVMVFPNAADAQVRQTQARQTQASASARTPSARRTNSPTRRAASQTRRAATPARAVSPPANDGATSPASGPAAIRAANAEALAPSRADGFVNAAQVFSFEQGRVYEVWTAPMRITALTLEPGERIINKAAGDTERWMIGDTTSGGGNAQQSQILIKPFRAGIATNMVIATNRRMYLLSLRAGESTDAFNAVVTWTYANSLPNGLTLTGTTGSPTTTPATIPGQSANIATLNQNYRIRAGWRRPAWTPISVSDDGRQTFITFPDSLGSTEAPPLFVMGENGEAQLTNWRKQGSVYVVDRLFDRAELRLGGDNPRVVRIERKGDRS